MAKKKAAPAIEFKPTCSTSCKRAGKCVWRRDGTCIALEGKGPKPPHVPLTAAKAAAEERKTKRAKW